LAGLEHLVRWFGPIRLPTTATVGAVGRAGDSSKDLPLLKTVPRCCHSSQYRAIECERNLRPDQVSH
jgi:hypothetical protein